MSSMTSGTLTLNRNDEVAPIVHELDQAVANVRGFRVRLIRFDRPESKTIVLSAKTERAASQQAQQRAGRTWRVARIQAIQD